MSNFRRQSGQDQQGSKVLFDWLQPTCQNFLLLQSTKNETVKFANSVDTDKAAQINCLIWDYSLSPNTLDNKIFLCKFSNNVKQAIIILRIQRQKENSVDPDEVAHHEPPQWLIMIYAVCKFSYFHL